MTAETTQTPLEDYGQPGDVRGFHYRDGLHFYRQQDGAVRVILYMEGPAWRGALQVGVIDPYSWASVVASMGAAGEDADTYARARDFHGCPPLSPTD